MKLFAVQKKLGFEEGRKEGREREGRKKEREGKSPGREGERRGEVLGAGAGGDAPCKISIAEQKAELGGSNPSACPRHLITALPLLGFAHSCGHK